MAVTSKTKEFKINQGYNIAEMIIYPTLRKITISIKCDLTPNVLNTINNEIVKMSSNYSSYSIKILDLRQFGIVVVSSIKKQLIIKQLEKMENLTEAQSKRAKIDLEYKDVMLNDLKELLDYENFATSRIEEMALMISLLNDITQNYKTIIESMQGVDKWSKKSENKRDLFRKVQKQKKLELISLLANF